MQPQCPAGDCAFLNQCKPLVASVDECCRVYKGCSFRDPYLDKCFSCNVTDQKCDQGNEVLSMHDCWRSNTDQYLQISTRESAFKAWTAKTHSSTWLDKKNAVQNLEVACTLIQKLNDASHAQTIQNAEVTWVPQHSIIRNLSHLCYSSTKLLQFATRRQTAPTPSVTQRKAKVQIAVTSTVDAPTMTRKPSNVLHVAVKLAVEKVTTVYYIRPLISNTVFAGCSTQTVKLWAVIHTTHMYTLWNRLFHANSYEKIINVSDDKAVSFWSK